VKKIMVVIKWVWQFPQNLVGFLLTRKYYMKSSRTTLDGRVTIYFKPFFRSGVSLGDYIILDKWYVGRDCVKTVCHEHGHQKQSMILGWFYLPLVGLPSILGNIWDRLFHKKWTNQRREKWYYNRYPEKWADLLGGVIRD
jgi:hypothetical protein